MDACILIGIRVVAVTGLVNDSIVAVSPIFRLLCGASYAVTEKGIAING